MNAALDGYTIAQPGARPGSPPERIGNRTDGQIDMCFTAFMRERPPHDAIGISLAMALSLILLLRFGFFVRPE